MRADYCILFLLAHVDMAFDFSDMPPPPPLPRQDCPDTPPAAAADTQTPAPSLWLFEQLSFSQQSQPPPSPP